MPRSVTDKQKIKEFLETTSNDQVESSIEEFEKLIATSSEEEKLKIDSDLAISLPDVIEPGSLDEYIYGCLSDVSETGNSCTPSCSNGYKSGDITECSLSIYEKKDGNINRLNNKKSLRAFLYVQQDDKFSEKDIKKLTKLNPTLHEVYIYTQDKSSKKYSHTDTHVVKKAQKKKKADPINLSYIMFLVLFLVILFIIVYFVYTTYVQSNSTNACLPSTGDAN
jgi:cell division protein FtsI/penicillin-binding protein 2